MQVIVQGWSRDHGQKVLHDSDVSTLKRKKNTVAEYAQDKVYLEVDDDDESVALKFYVGGANLTGNYQATIVLNASEIKNLFLASHKHKPLGDIFS